MRLDTSFLFVVLTAALLAQDPPSRAPDPVALVAKAEKLCSKKEDVEDAALLLWQALEILATKPAHPMRDATAMTARYLLNEHDPLEKERRRVYESIARQQVELAQAYRSRKWFDVAATRIDVAVRFDRDAAAKERTLLEAARPKPKAAAAAGEKPGKPRPSPLLQRENTKWVSGDWREVDDRLEFNGGADGHGEWVTNDAHADHEVVVEFRAEDAAKQHNAALAVGLVVLAGTDNFSGYRAHCIYDTQDKSLGIVIWNIRGQETKKLGEVRGKPATTPDGFHRLSVQVHGRTLRAQIDAQSPVEVVAAEDVRGRVGLVVGMSDRPTCAMQFRNLRIDPLPADAPTDEEVREQAQAEVQQSITDCVDEAKSLLTRKQPEQASLRLREALGELRYLTAGMLRTNLATSIEQMLNQADSLAPKRKKAGLSIAAELAGLADKYAAAGMARLALSLVEDAADFDPDGQAARLAAAREAVQKWNLAQATARASELAPPTDDGTVLREWFTQGKKLDSRSPDWRVEGPSARIEQLPPIAAASWMPKPGTPPLTKASVFVLLPQDGATAGFCFDVAGVYDYSVAFLERSREGLVLFAFRYANAKWTELGRKTMPLEPWRRDGWFPINLEATATGITVRGAGGELVLDRKVLGDATGRFGLFATNWAKVPVTVEVRAFRVGP